MAFQIGIAPRAPPRTMAGSKPGRSGGRLSHPKASKRAHDPTKSEAMFKYSMGRGILHGETGN